MCTRYHCGQFQYDHPGQDKLMCTGYRCGQYDHPGRRTSSCAQDIVVVSFSTITLGVRQAHVHRISLCSVSVRSPWA